MFRSRTMRREMVSATQTSGFRRIPTNRNTGAMSGNIESACTLNNAFGRISPNMRITIEAMVVCITITVSSLGVAPIQTSYRLMMGTVKNKVMNVAYSTFTMLLPINVVERNASGFLIKYWTKEDVGPFCLTLSSNFKRFAVT